VITAFRGAAQASINFEELVVDNFAGGGGASTGIELALGRPVDIAINHDIDAIRMHEVNHPHTKHYCESVWDIDPVEVTQGRPVGLAWFSPDCKHFSKARGGTPVSKKIRGLAWIAIRWAAKVKPRIIMLENVEEFTTWGPIEADESGDLRPCPKRKGETFKQFIRALERQAYTVEYRELRASDYGTPTIRKRLFLIARRDGLPIVWPAATHGKDLIPHRTAAECIDWSIPCPSIFERKRPLAEATMKRIAAGIMRFVVNADDPFIVSEKTAAPFITEHANASNQRNMAADQSLRTICAQVKGGHFALVSAFLAKHYTGVVGVEVLKPMPTITTSDHNALVTSNLVKFRGTCRHGQSTDSPLATISAQGNHLAEVRAFLVKYYGQGGQLQSLNEPMHTIPTKDRIGLVMVKGEPYQIVDIGMRMLSPRELFNAQGFPADYIIDHDGAGKAFTKTTQVARCGNSVCPPLAAALVQANMLKVMQQVAA